VKSLLVHGLNILPSSHNQTGLVQGTTGLVRDRDGGRLPSPRKTAILVAGGIIEQPEGSKA
jgi:hypothetical protein